MHHRMEQGVHLLHIHYWLPATNECYYCISRSRLCNTVLTGNSKMLRVRVVHVQRYKLTLYWYCHWLSHWQWPCIWYHWWNTPRQNDRYWFLSTFPMSAGCWYLWLHHVTTIDLPPRYLTPGNIA